MFCQPIQKRVLGFVFLNLFYKFHPLKQSVIMTSIWIWMLILQHVKWKMTMFLNNLQHLSVAKNLTAQWPLQNLETVNLHSKVKAYYSPCRFKQSHIFIFPQRDCRLSQQRQPRLCCLSFIYTEPNSGVTMLLHCVIFQIANRYPIYDKWHSKVGISVWCLTIGSTF